MSTPSAPGSNRTLVLTAMIFAVAMTFIDQTIVSIAAPNIQSELGLSTPACSGRSTPTCSRSPRFRVRRSARRHIGPRRMV